MSPTAKQQAAAPTLYQCQNPACSLGTVGAPGQFTAGATVEFTAALTGADPDTLVDGTDYGDGICPNCATAGTDIGVLEPIGA